MKTDGTYLNGLIADKKIDAEGIDENRYPVFICAFCVKKMLKYPGAGLQAPEI
jgi:hypothetical protein